MKNFFKSTRDFIYNALHDVFVRPYIFLKNIYLFKHELYEFRWWDWNYNLEIFKRSLEITEKNVREKGMEIEETRLLKCDKMERAIEIMDNVMSCSYYIDEAEDELGELVDAPDGKLFHSNEHNSKVFKKSTELEEQEWDELMAILKGQGYVDEDYDGTGLKTWWD